MQFSAVSGECLTLTAKKYFNEYLTPDDHISVTNSIAYDLESVDIDGEGRIYQNGTNYQYDYYLKDHLGSTRMVINDQNQITEAIAYQPYGTIVPMEDIATSTQTSTRQQFTGKEFDREGSGVGISGMDLYYFGKRYYNPELGVWISTDPKEQYWNSYAYCGGDPVNYIDPNGELAGLLLGQVIGLAAGATIGGIVGGIIAHENDGNMFLGIAGGAILGGAAGGLIGMGIGSLSEKLALIPAGGSGIQAPNLFQRSDILKMIGKFAGNGFNFVGRHLVFNQAIGSMPRSEYYQNRLIEGINAKKNLDIRIASDMPNPQYEALKVLDKALKFKGNSVIPRRKPVAGGNYWMRTVRITGQDFYAASENTLFSPEEILMHELVGHGIPDIAGPSSGNAITNDNIARRQAGLKKRPEDPNHIE